MNLFHSSRGSLDNLNIHHKKVPLLELLLKRTQVQIYVVLQNPKHAFYFTFIWILYVRSSWHVMPLSPCPVNEDNRSGRMSSVPVNTAHLVSVCVMVAWSTGRFASTHNSKVITQKSPEPYQKVHQDNVLYSGCNPLSAFALLSDRTAQRMINTVHNGAEAAEMSHMWLSWYRGWQPSMFGTDLEVLWGVLWALSSLSCP